MMCGGLANDKQADEEVQTLIEKIKDDVKIQSGGKDFPQLKAVSYKTQVVAGMNYFVKVDAGSEHIHLRIYQPLPHTGEGPQLHGVQLGKSLQDPIEHF